MCIEGSSKTKAALSSILHHAFPIFWGALNQDEPFFQFLPPELQVRIPGSNSVEIHLQTTKTALNPAQIISRSHGHTCIYTYNPPALNPVHYVCIYTYNQYINHYVCIIHQCFFFTYVSYELNLLQSNALSTKPTVEPRRHIQPTLWLHHSLCTLAMTATWHYIVRHHREARGGS
jgi:hypothetical protein